VSAPQEVTAPAAISEASALPVVRGPWAAWWHGHWSAVGKGTLAVVGFWWFVTGVVVALQRNEVTRLIAWVLSTMLAMYATHVIHISRAVSTASSARRTFLAATAIWLWINVSLYGGWIVGPSHAATVSGGATVFRATEAIASLLYHELLCVLVLFGVWLHVRLSPNRLAFHGLFTYWAVLQIAKLNIFFGVANPGARFLPPHLEFLLSYYGPAANSGWLAVSFFGAVGVALIFWWRGREAPTPLLRQGRALIAMLFALAAVEYLLLGIKTDAPLWEVFLKVRGF
jgi:putative photosynthetic complex assembly protein 2